VGTEKKNLSSISSFSSILNLSGIKFVTPHARHSGKDKEILKNRDKVYKEARKRRPDRWTGNTRNWDLITHVALNPDMKKDVA